MKRVLIFIFLFFSTCAMELEEASQQDEVEKGWERTESGRLVSREKGSEECEKCSICWKPLSSGETLCGAYLFGCSRKHKFHKACIERVLKGGDLGGAKCPLCRFPLRKKFHEQYLSLPFMNNDEEELALFNDIFDISSEDEEYRLAILFLWRNSPEDFSPRDPV